VAEIKNKKEVKDLAVELSGIRKAGKTGFTNLIPALVQILFGLLLFRDLILLFFF